jgi:hypothetical protein
LEIPQLDITLFRYALTIKNLIINRFGGHPSMEFSVQTERNVQHGQTPWEALRTAQLKMKGKYPPFYRSAFVLVE